MKLFAWLERHLSRFAIPNVTLLIIIGQVALYLVAMPQGMNGELPPILENTALIPAKVLEGEWWRLFTFLLFPPRTNVIFAFFTWYIFYLMGTALESVWGTFRFNLFLLLGAVASVGASFLQPEIHASNTFLYGTVFLAFARFYPDFVINIMMVLPIKIKWLALIMWLGYGLNFLTGDGTQRMLIVAAVANYLVFFWRDHLYKARDHRRRLNFATKTAKAKAITHTCATCGLSSTDEPRTQFRYCSQCDGQCCYCPQHIRDHEHVVERAAVE